MSKATSQSLLSPLFLFLLAGGVFALALEGPPVFDELYHVLAARGWLATGEFAIAEGIYDRTSLFTLLIAALFHLFGESMAVARLPSMVAFALLVAALFTWLRPHVGGPAAWVAALLLLTSPFTIELATFARFYGIQALAFFLGVVAVEKAVRVGLGPGRRLLLLTAAASGFALALYLQIVTAIGLMGLALWVALEIGGPWLLAMERRRRWTVLAGVLLLGLALLLVLVESGTAARLIERYRWAPAWLEGTADQVWFYHYWFVLYYPTLWTLSPLLVGVALARHGRVARLSFAIFAVAFLAHSFAAMKDTRYIAYALPFLFALFGMGIAGLWPAMRRLVVELCWRIVPRPSSPALARGVEVAVPVLVLLFVVLANAATVRSVFMLAGVRVPPQPPLTQWAAAARELAPWLTRADVVLTTSELDALYYLDRYDVLINRSRLTELHGAEDFTRDFRTGRPVIASPEALARIIDCVPTGLVVASRNHWRSPSRLDDQAADLLVRRARRLELPRRWAIEAYVWDHEPAGRDSPTCRQLVEEQLEKKSSPRLRAAQE